ncbi:hypothetical protein ACFUIT_22070 [Streptomyces sp. NPDC057239]|uniref:hypothetical protein n=1 Tax=Streptomyces sp. NPDC057239 TaxID=3346061 RepID=UPI0036330B34
MPCRATSAPPDHRRRGFSSRRAPSLPYFPRRLRRRSGSIDPGEPTWLRKQHHLSADDIEDVLNHESGLRAPGGDGTAVVSAEGRSQ